MGIGCENVGDWGEDGGGMDCKRIEKGGNEMGPSMAHQEKGD